MQEARKSLLQSGILLIQPESVSDIGELVAISKE